MQTVEFLSRSLGPRPAGTDGEHKAVDYIRSRLHDLGLSSRAQPFAFRNWRALGPAVLRLQSAQGDSEDIEGIALPYTAATPTLGISGVLRWQGHWPIIPRRLECPRFAVHSSDDLPVAAVVAAPFGRPRPLPNPQPLLVVPTIVISMAAGDRVRELTEAAQEPVLATIMSSSVQEETLISTNLVADVGVSSRRLVVMAHYDCVPDSPGANDNASGVAILLRLAQHFADKPGGPIGLRFIFCGAEEPFLVGSRAYVAELATRGDLAQLAACLNLDMLGVGHEFSLRRVEGSLWAQAATAVGEWSPHGLAFHQTESMASSDHWSFHEAGIPSAQLTRGPDPEWHTPGDVPDRFTTDHLDDAELLAQRLLDEALDLLARGAERKQYGIAEAGLPKLG